MPLRICPQCGVETQDAVCPTHQCPTVLRSGGSLDQLVAGTVVGGRYRIERQLGRGGFGAVFLSSHVATRQELVLKILKPDLSEDPTQVQRFFNEARASSLLSHPHTVRVFDFGQTDSGLLYIAMERLHGKELAQVLRETPDRRLEPARALRIAIAVCKSLSEAHHAGLVHRDLKPDNIFMCQVHGEDEFVKVIDFGIAKPTNAPTEDGLTKTGFAVGTPKYMSPEQVTNKPLDGRSDLYALGVILYQVLAGEVPLAGASPMETLVAHLHTAPVPLREKVSGLPAALNDLVMRALRKAPWDRFVDADDMRVELEAVLAELPDARPRPTTGRMAQPKLGDTVPAVPKPPAAADVSPATGSRVVPNLVHDQATAFVELATNRDAYLPQTMTLPTQPVEPTRPPAATVAPPGGPTRLPMAALWLAAAGALILVAVVGWWLLGRGEAKATPAAAADPHAAEVVAPAAIPAVAPAREPVAAPVRDPVPARDPAPVQAPAPAPAQVQAPAPVAVPVQDSAPVPAPAAAAPTPRPAKAASHPARPGKAALPSGDTPL